MNLDTGGLKNERLVDNGTKGITQNEICFYAKNWSLRDRKPTANGNF